MSEKAEEVSGQESGKILRIDEGKLRGHLDQVVRGTEVAAMLKKSGHFVQNRCNEADWRTPRQNRQ